MSTDMKELYADEETHSGAFQKAGYIANAVLATDQLHEQLTIAAAFCDDGKRRQRSSNTSHRRYGN